MESRSPQPGREFFTAPTAVNHRRYEALRAYYVEGLTLQQAADRFGYTRWAMVNLVRQLRTDELSLFAPPAKPGPKSAPRKDPVRDRVIELRRQGRSVYEISRALAAEGTPLNRTGVGEILAEEGFGRLLRGPEPDASVNARHHRPRHPPARAGSSTSPRSPTGSTPSSPGCCWSCPTWSPSTCPPWWPSAGYPGTNAIPAVCRLLSLLALKLTRTRRVSHVDDLLLDPAAPCSPGWRSCPRNPR